MQSRLHIRQGIAGDKHSYVLQSSQIHLTGAGSKELLNTGYLCGQRYRKPPSFARNSYITDVMYICIGFCMCVQAEMANICYCNAMETLSAIKEAPHLARSSERNY